ncbi:MAG: type III pantothenate kinase [Deltaproteobacteria bacterium]|nr:type III pantothenate kinase [Deltaproteobacteria bacterium]
MLLAIDIGNTNIVLGLFEGDGLKAHWRVSADKKRTHDEYGALLISLITRVSRGAISGSIICSVVPELTPVIKSALKKHLGLEGLIAGEDIPFPIPVLTDNPREVGADRIVNVVAAYREHKTSLIVVDFGTAVTFDYVTTKGEYGGGVIAPGVAISAGALFEKTAKLPKVDVIKPASVIGKNTVSAMQSGIYWGFIGLVDGIIERMMAELKDTPEIAATGGLAPLVAGQSKYVASSDEFLTLKGLKIIYEGKR